MAKVIIEVEGGCVQSVYTDSGDVGEYVIIDRDVQEERDDDYISKWGIENIPSYIEREIEGTS